MSSPVEVLLPQYGMGMREGVVVEWLVGLGDQVIQGQVIAQIEIEKVEVELEAPTSGRIAEILVAEGDSAVVQQVVARIEPT